MPAHGSDPAGDFAAASHWRVERELYLLIAVVCLLRLALILRGWPEAGLLADDAFYYFTIARNIVVGQGVTFDGLAPTNGFHPLWLSMLVPLFRLFEGDPWVPIRAALVAALVVDVITGLVVYRGLSRSAGRGAALIGVTLWFLTPFVFSLGMQGMEGSVHALCIVLLWRFLASSSFQLRPVGWKAYVGAGALIGLAGWARSDAPLLMGVAFTMSVLLGPVERFGGWLGRCGA